LLGAGHQELGQSRWWLYDWLRRAPADALALVKANTAVFDRLGVQSVPAIVYRDAAMGAAGVEAGYRPPQQITALVEARGTALPTGEPFTPRHRRGASHLRCFDSYTCPASGEAQLGPAFDIVNTTMYLPNDTLALKLAGVKLLFALQLGLVELPCAC
jgi:hypothetical protein